MPSIFGRCKLKLYVRLFIVGFISLLFITGCAEKRPVLYPNYHLKQVGMSRAEDDINECICLVYEDFYLSIGFTFCEFIDFYFVIGGISICWLPTTPKSPL